MRTYCTLVISSNEDEDLCETVASLFGVSPTAFIDNRSSERQERITRLRQALPKLAHIEPPRYVWTLSSQGRVASEDFEPHMRWLLEAIAETGHSLSELRQRICQVYVTCFWEGAGRGGGPTIRPGIAKQLVMHDVELRFDNYCSEE